MGNFKNKSRFWQKFRTTNKACSYRVIYIFSKSANVQQLFKYLYKLFGTLVQWGMGGSVVLTSRWRATATTKSTTTDRAAFLTKFTCGVTVLLLAPRNDFVLFTIRDGSNVLTCRWRATATTKSATTDGATFLPFLTKSTCGVTVLLLVPRNDFVLFTIRGGSNVLTCRWRAITVTKPATNGRAAFLPSRRISVPLVRWTTPVAHRGFDFWFFFLWGSIFLKSNMGERYGGPQTITAGTAVAMSLIVLVSDPTPHVKCFLVVSSRGGGGGGLSKSDCYTRGPSSLQGHAYATL